MTDARAQVLQEIDEATVALRGAALPHELAELAELRLDAEEASDLDQLARIRAHARGLRAFCEGRKRSSLRAHAVRKAE